MAARVAHRQHRHRMSGKSIGSRRKGGITGVVGPTQQELLRQHPYIAQEETDTLEVDLAVYPPMAKNTGPGEMAV